MLPQFRYLLSVIILPFLLTSCFKKRPLQLVLAEQDLLEVAADEEVVRKSPVILEQAARAYHKAELTWRESGNTDATVPLALLAQDLILEARENLESRSEIDNSARGSFRQDALLLERRTGLAKFDSDIPGKPTSFSTNRIDPSLIEQPSDTESLEASLFFLSGSSILSANGQIALIPISDYLLANPYKKVSVQVHTNNSNSTFADLVLAQAQADTVRNYFIAKGISPSRIEAHGLISSVPSPQNISPPSIGGVRRIVFKYIPFAG